MRLGAAPRRPLAVAAVLAAAAAAVPGCGGQETEYLEATNWLLNEHTSFFLGRHDDDTLYLVFVNTGALDGQGPRNQMSRMDRPTGAMVHRFTVPEGGPALAMRCDPPYETLVVDDAAYPLADGRVFLVDVEGDAPAVEQVNVPLPSRGHQFGEAEFVAASDPRVGAFTRYSRP